VRVQGRRASARFEHRKIALLDLVQDIVPGYISDLQTGGP
jgi:hypothetical protein